ncbi:putative dihydroxyacetone kinase isoform X2 [Andrena cerasifolii]|uniref:putative dihydroxyacetone kinase isoform X2 n=1 Tax=Andrena cerasifolii TaxID=2819439 RepID=UPI0040382FEA
MTEVDEVKLITGGEFSKNDDTLDITLQGPMLSHETGQTFLLVISMACKAIIACTRQLNKIDEEFGNRDYGTTLAHGATVIEAAIQENKTPGRNPFATFMQISRIIERTAFMNYQSDEQVTAHTWLDALVTANEAIKQFKTPSIGDQTLITVLVAVQVDLTTALINNVDPIDAFGIAVKAAENFHINHKLKHPNPQAHAVGIWMRAAYEGTKLKLIH